ncbi:uncharacterized protein LOC128961924 [Oppia nitens]|uniref:uncharacterized protein LOC128961924 n=1 Tax=Oppia nitens TaxID=1686743 RepID=UPI0023DA6C07|nr:uncharacterized protein LOC128961924 [Oppia nitens]
MPSPFHWLSSGSSLQQEWDNAEQDPSLTINHVPRDYPNYAIQPHYDPELQEARDNMLIALGGAIGFMSGCFGSLSFNIVKYNRLGYTGIHVLERLPIPVVKWSVLGGIAGMAVGLVNEGQRMIREDKNLIFNSKIASS